MKKVIALLTILLVVAFVGGVAYAQDISEGYVCATCSMASKDPGKCPTCDMDLVKGDVQDEVTVNPDGTRTVKIVPAPAPVPAASEHPEHPGSK